LGISNADDEEEEEIKPKDLFVFLSRFKLKIQTYYEKLFPIFQ